MDQGCGELLFVNGRIWLAPPQTAEVEALLVRQGRVAAVGELAAVRAVAGAALEVDLQGATLLPGLIDAHCHLLWYGEMQRRWVDLRGATSLAEIQARLRQRFAERPPAPGEWLLGRAFDQDRLPGGRMPTAADLDAVASDVPIVIQRVCCHALVANTRAQALAGVQAPEGLLTEDAMDAVWRVVPPMTAAERVAAAELACREAAAVGFTGAQCIVATAEEVAAFRELARRGALPIHLRLLAGDLALLDPPEAREVVPCRTLKLFADGSLGARTAALSQPYADQPETSGRLLWDPPALRECVRRAHCAGYQVAIHAIGDAAIEAALTAIAAAQAAHPRPGARHRVEHASVLPPHLVDRLATLGVTTVVQPQFTVSDFWTGARLGVERAGWAYPFRTLLRKGVPVAGSTDCPVETLDPFQAIARAVARTVRAERLRVPEAVALFTRGAAYAGFGEEEHGALFPGYQADLLVVPEDPRELRPRRLAALRPELTLVDGRVVHAAGRFRGLG